MRHCETCTCATARCQGCGARLRQPQVGRPRKWCARETVPGPITGSGAGKTRRIGLAVGSMTLMRVIARSASGNAFARSEVWGHEAALGLAREWIETHPGIEVTVEAVYA